MITPIGSSQPVNSTNFTSKFKNKYGSSHKKADKNTFSTSLPSVSTNAYFGINGERNNFRDAMKNMTYAELCGIESKLAAGEEGYNDENSALKLYDVRDVIYSRIRHQGKFGEFIVNPFYPSLSDVFGEDVLRGHSAAAAKLRIKDKKDSGDLHALNNSAKYEALERFFEVKDAISALSNAQLNDLLDNAQVQEDRFVADAKVGRDMSDYTCMATYQIEAIKSELNDRKVYGF